MFSNSPALMLFYDVITLRDILSVRMGMFSSSVILRILSDTLILLLVAVGLRRRLKAKPSNSENVFERS